MNINNINNKNKSDIEKIKKEQYFEATKYENIKELIYASSKKFENNIAYIIKNKQDKKITYKNITYKELLKDINALGTTLYDLGYQNKRIAIVGRNRYEWSLSHLTNLLGNMISIPLDKELQVDELESCLVRSKADVVIFDEKYIDNINEIKNRNNTNLKNYICMNKIENYTSIHELLEKGYKLIEDGNNTYINAKIDSYKMSILLFTSGTTSKSKGVCLSQNNITSNIYDMQLVENFKENDINLAFLPFHHIFGSTAMLVMLAYGITTAFPDGLRYIAQNLKEYKVSVFVGVPLLIEAIYKKLEQGIEKKGKTKQVNFGKKLTNFLLHFNIDIKRKLFKEIIDELGGSLRYIVSGGAPLDKKVAKGFNELGIKLVQGYGLTETSPVISAENFKKIKYGSVGIPMEEVEIKLENKDKNGIGELHVKGPNVMLGYYENEEATKNVLKNGWFNTGDLAYVDKDGYLFITGRKKDMIVLKNGKKVFPEELEVLVNRINEVEESFVFGLPETQKNDIKLSVAIVYNKEYIKENYPNIKKDELEKIVWNKIKEINKTLPPYKYIKNLYIENEELIKTTTKKIKRNEQIKKYI